MVVAERHALIRDNEVLVIVGIYCASDALALTSGRPRVKARRAGGNAGGGATLRLRVAWARDEDGCVVFEVSAEFWLLNRSGLPLQCCMAQSWGCL